MRFCSTGSGFAHCSSDSVQQLTQKDKVLWKGASRGSVQEQGLSTPSVTLVSLQIGFVLVNEGERKEEKRHMSNRKREKTVLLWLMSGSLPATQAMFVVVTLVFRPRVDMLFFASFCFFSLFSHYSCFFFWLLAETGPYC